MTPFDFRDANTLKKTMQSLAALDAILSPEWEYRYYSFDKNWSEDEEMGSIRNGSGDDVFVLFNSSGCFMKGFCHEYDGYGNGNSEYYRTVPEEFGEATTEPAFSTQNVSYCFWFLNKSKTWAGIQATNKSEEYWLVDNLDGSAEKYGTFALDYFETKVPIRHIRTVLKHKLISEKIARKLNPEIDYSQLLTDLRSIGYPIKSI